jgi:HTH-type transcriptional regulator/antitoxin HigA
MRLGPIIGSEFQSREIVSELLAIGQTLSSEQLLNSILQGLPREAIEGVRRSLLTEKRELSDILAAYQEAKSGNFEPLKARAGNDIGDRLVVARLTKGWSQKDLARRLGLREQAIQRYEIERYRSISLSGLLRVTSVLGVQLTLDLSSAPETAWTPSFELSPAEAQKVLKHARGNGWLHTEVDSDDTAMSQLKRYVAEHVGEYGTPSLLRTGLNVRDHSEDWVLLCWKAQVTRRAKVIIQQKKVRYRALDVSWLIELVHLSSLEDGPARAIDLLGEHGIVVLAEPHIPGMKVDGAAFLVDDVPVVGLTLLRDSLDNFWFTLLHEVAHIVLHYRTGLASGFFDDLEAPHVDEFEEEANKFASNMLLPEEIWSRSTARIAKSAEPIERLANQLKIAPAIIFGRVRMERNNYALFSDKIGIGKVRTQLLPRQQDANHAASI